MVGFTTQASIDPPRMLVCLSVKNRTHRVALGADVLAVHVLDPDDGALAELFGGETGDDVDKFARVEWSPGTDGVPLLEECRRRFVGRVLDRFELGDHTGFLLDPIEATSGATGLPWAFSRSRTSSPGTRREAARRRTRTRPRLWTRSYRAGRGGHDAAPSSRETARAVSRTWSLAGWRARSAPDGMTTPMAPTASP